jgi:hypothetical protein
VFCGGWGATVTWWQHLPQGRLTTAIAQEEKKQLKKQVEDGLKRRHAVQPLFLRLATPSSLFPFLAGSR